MVEDIRNRPTTYLMSVLMSLENKREVSALITESDVEENKKAYSEVETELIRRLDIEKELKEQRGN